MKANNQISFFRLQPEAGRLTHTEMDRDIQKQRNRNTQISNVHVYRK